MAGADGRRALRTIEVECPAWADGVTRIREPRVRDFLAAEKAASEQERTILLLGNMVLDDAGNPVGQEAIEDAGLAALLQLSRHLETLLGEVTAPLGQTSISSTGSASPSAG